MKKLVGIFVLVIGMSLTARAADDAHKLDARLSAARATIDEIMSVPDKAVPDGIARKAVCVGVVPGLVKGAFILGAEYGQGVVTCRTGAGWSAPVFIRMAGGSFLVAVNDKGFQDLLHDKFKIGGDASAAAGPVGRDAQASTDLSMRAELLTWSRSRGVFAGVDLNGISVSQNREDTDEIYGGAHPFNQILHGAVAPPEVAEPFLHAVSRYFGNAEASR
jgi:lipid-binding SYLF domain-containing protein